MYIDRHPGLGATVEMICATFTFVTWKNPLNGQPRSTVKVYVY